MIIDHTGPLTGQFGVHLRSLAGGVGTLTWLFVKHRETFPVFRTAMVLPGIMGFFFFFMFPVAPPRFLGDLGFVDTVTFTRKPIACCSRLP